MKYDKEVLTINDILTALDNFDNKEEIINAIKQSLYDIETDWHNEEYLKQQLQAYKDKEEKTKQIFINLLFKLGELNKQYKDNKSDDYGIRTQDYLELYKILNEGEIWKIMLIIHHTIQQAR